MIETESNGLNLRLDLDQILWKKLFTVGVV